MNAKNRLLARYNYGNNNKVYKIYRNMKQENLTGTAIYLYIIYSYQNNGE